MIAVSWFLCSTRENGKKEGKPTRKKQRRWERSKPWEQDNEEGKGGGYGGTGGSGWQILGERQTESARIGKAKVIYIAST